MHACTHARLALPVAAAPFALPSAPMTMCYCRPPPPGPCYCWQVDLPDSGDFWEFAKETLVSEFGLDPERIFPISAATGQGVTTLVRAVRGVLDAMGPAEVQYETDAVNQTQAPKRGAAGAPMDDFRVTVEEDAAGARVYVIEGEGIERFAQMTNWDYYEAVRRFQRVLDVTGMNAALRARGVKEGDTVAIGEAEFYWQDTQSQTKMYQSWLKDMKERGVTLQGVAHWPAPDLRSDRRDEKKDGKKL